MVMGKNKRMGKKGKGKKTVDPFIHKEWYDVKAPSIFTKRNVGKTLVTKSQGKRLSSDDLKGRVFEVCLADLQDNEDQAFRKIRMICEDVQGTNCLLNFHGMSFTTDKLRSMVKKWQTLIEAHVDVKTTDNYYLRMFCIGFTKKQKEQQKKTSYAQSAQVRQIRKVMMEKMAKEASSSDFRGLCQKFINGDIGGDIVKQTQGIYPLKDVYIRKVKVLKKPKYDHTRLMEMHGGAKGTTKASAGGKVARSGDFVEPLPSENI
jgi:small subunit ribosomal protein S3Ae